MITFHNGTVEARESNGRIAARVPDLFDDEVLTGLVPIFPPWMEMQPAIGDPIRVVVVGGEYWYFSLAKPGTATDAAVMWSPLKTILVAMLDNLDSLNSHGHTIATSGITVGVAPGPVLTNAAPVAVPAVAGCSYGDARTDTEGDTPAHPIVRLVTSMPTPEGA